MSTVLREQPVLQRTSRPRPVPRRLTTRRVEKAALLDVVPVLIGLIPFAGIVGITMARLGIPTFAGLTGSALMFSGSAQLAILGLMASGAGIGSMVLSAALVNSRFAMYGGAMEPFFRQQPAWFRWIGPAFLVDQNFGLVRARTDLQDPVVFRRYWLTASAAIGVTWLATIGLVMTFGTAISNGSPVLFTGTCIYVALLVPSLKGRRAIGPAGSAAATAIALSHLAPGVGVLAGVLVGIAVAAAIDGGKR